ncbi:late cornified envelope protein 3C-like [Ctenodactylus gundi]
MSYQQNQQQCQPPPQCPSPKCPPKSPGRCLPTASSSCASSFTGCGGLSSGGCRGSSSAGCGGLSSGGCRGSSSESGSCLSPHRRRRSHRCRLRSSDSCEGGSDLQSGDSGCGHNSGGYC